MKNAKNPNEGHFNHPVKYPLHILIAFQKYFFHILIKTNLVLLTSLNLFLGP